MKHLLPKNKLLYFLMLGLIPLGSYAQKNYNTFNGTSAVKDYFITQQSVFNANEKELNELIITSDYTDQSVNIRHIYAQQRYNGLDVVNGVAALHTRDGQPVHAEYQFLKLDGATGAAASLSSAQAVLKALDETGFAQNSSDLQMIKTFAGPEQKTIYKALNTAWDIPVRKAYVLDKETKRLTLVWEVQLYSSSKKNYWILYLDAATGKLLARHDMVVKCEFDQQHLVTDEDLSGNDHFSSEGSSTGFQTSIKQQGNNVPQVPVEVATPLAADPTQHAVNNQYRVFDRPFEAPNSTGAVHALKSTAGNALASPDGWHKILDTLLVFQYTRGNNVWAFQDPSPGPLGGIPSVDPTRTAYNNGGPLGTPTLTEPFLFDYPINFNNDPTTYQKAAIVNLFYWNNLMHDVFYQFGFTEAAGNFQQSHSFSTGLNRGNKPTGENDAVLAQAQDGGGTNNANFLTLADGINGQMQMYLWTGSVPDSIVRVVSNTQGVPPAGKKYYSIQGSFGNSVVANNDLYASPVLNKQFVIVQKNAASAVGSSSEGCGTGQQSVALPPANDVNGKIVLIDRGSCSFVEKVLGAQLGGAAGVIVINNVPGQPPAAMGGSDAPTNAIIIPAVMISYEDGKELKAALTNGATIAGTLQKTFPSIKRDGDIDNGIIAHEYGHGISTRLTAGGPNPTSRLGGDEQGGEGWSDNFALYMTQTAAGLLPATPEHPNGILPDRGIGTYVVYQNNTGGGIRPTPYSINMNVNPSTYKTVGKGGEITIPHGVGYVWCSMLYEMQQELIDQYGFNNDVYNAATPVNGNVPPGAGGNNVAMRLVMEGLKLQPASPTFIQQRDAILKADTLLYGAQHACRIWKAFAKRGLGFSAAAGTNGVGDETEQFNVSPLCNPQTVLTIKKTGPFIMTNQEEIEYKIQVVNISPITLAAGNLLVTDTLPALTTYLRSDGGTLNGNVVSWPLASLNAGDTITHTVTVKANHPTPATLLLSEDNEGAVNKFSSINTGLQQFSLISTGAFSGTKTWFIEDYDIPGSNATLVLKNKFTVPASGAFLIFNHKYATEAEYDGGVVEVSTDSISWAHLNTFTQNNYNGIISNIDNPLIGTGPLPAFTGTSPGYIQSIASLNAFANQAIYFRFRFTSDNAGGSIDGGGWWIDDIYLASAPSFVKNKAAANASNAASIAKDEFSTLIIVSPCINTLNQPIPVAAGTYTADAVCIDNFANWMHFYKGTDLLISIKKTAETAGISPANVKLGVDAGNEAVYITAPYALAMGDPRWYVMRRYWNITSTTPLTSPVAVRFYYTPAEYDELKAKAVNVTTDSNAKVYKFTSQADPDPATGHAGVQAADVVYPAYTYLGTNSNYKQIQFNVNQFSGGGIGGTGTPPTLYVFTGNGNWNVAANWMYNLIPPAMLPSGREILISPSSGQCILNVPQTIQPGGKLTVSEGKNFVIQGNLTQE